VSGIGESYICDCCGGTFVKTRSDEEALAEARSEWKPGGEGDVSNPEDNAVICDDCFRELMEWAKVNAPEALR
jgi:hypothetical protein